MIDATSSTCFVCCMEIPAAAKICPYCKQKITSRKPIIIPSNYGLASILLSVICLLVLSSFVYFNILSNDESFADYQHLVTSEVTEMKFRTGDWGGESSPQEVVVFGKIKNESPLKWKDLLLEVQMFNKDGELIDVEHSSNSLLRVSSNGQRDFSVTSTLDYFAEEYSSAKVRILAANINTK